MHGKTARTQEAASQRRPSGDEIEAMLDRLLAPPAVVAGQVAMNAGTRIDCGEMRLALAVLEDALRCALRHHRSRLVEQRRAARDALRWMHSDDDAPAFGFVRICQLFDLDPGWIRATVRRRIAPVRAARRADERARRAA
jgi:hypothetical protein